MHKSKRLYPVFAPGQSFQSHPYTFMEHADAQDLVRYGFAEAAKGGKAIRLFARSLPKLRDRSCSWSHRLMELVGEGNYTALVMLSEIQPQIRFAA